MLVGCGVDGLIDAEIVIPTLVGDSTFVNQIERVRFPANIAIERAGPVRLLLHQIEVDRPRAYERWILLTVLGIAFCYARYLPAFLLEVLRVSVNPRS
jgi:hypothetical protein